MSRPPSAHDCEVEPPAPVDPTARARWITGALPWAALIAVLVAAWLPFAVPETIAGHSVLSDRVRAEAIHAAVAGGDLAPAWLPDLYHRHGSPLPSFYAPFAYAVVELLRGLTGRMEPAFKLAYVLFWVLGATGAALAARLRFGVGAGIPAAAAFALAPYTLADAYVRAGIAEFAALALLPWALAALAASGAAALGGIAVTVALLVVTHNITALIAVPALALLALFSPPPARRATLGGIALGLALSTFFWLPALVESRWLWSESSLTTNFFDFGRHFVAPRDLLPGRTSLHFTIGPAATLPFRFGELLLAAAVAAIPLATLRRTRDRRASVLLSAAALAALLLTSSLSEPIWRALPLARYVQFPFRFFLLATAFAAPLVGFLVVQAAPRWRSPLAALAVALALLIARPYLSARYFFVDRTTLSPLPILASEIEKARSDPRLFEVEELVTLERLRSQHWSGAAGHEYLPRTVTQPPGEPAGQVPTVAAEALGAGIQVLSSAWAYPEVRAQVEVTSPGEIALHQFWFPGWRVTVDGATRATRAEPERGRILVAVRPGEREIRARFGPTTLRSIARAASLLTALGLAIALFVSRARRAAGTPG